MSGRLILVLALGAASIARADAPFVPAEEQTRLWLDADWFPSPDAQVVAMSANGQVRVQRNVVLTFDLPWAVGGITGDPDARAGLGNAEVGLRGVGLVRPFFALWGGLSATVPTMYQVPETNAGIGTAGVLTFAALSDDGLELERYLPQFAALRLTPLGFEARFARRWRLRSELALLIWLGAGPNTGYWDYTLEWWGEIEARLPHGFVAGARVQLVYAFGQATVGGEPYIGYEPATSGLFARLGLLIGTGLGSGTVLFREVAIGPYSDPVIATLRARIGYRF